MAALFNAKWRNHKMGSHRELGRVHCTVKIASLCPRVFFPMLNKRRIRKFLICKSQFTTLSWRDSPIYSLLRHPWFYALEASVSDGLDCRFRTQISLHQLITRWNRSRKENQWSGFFNNWLHLVHVKARISWSQRMSVRDVFAKTLVSYVGVSY